METTTRTQTEECSQRGAAETLRFCLTHGQLALIIRGGTYNPPLTTVSVLLLHNDGGYPTNITRTVGEATGMDSHYGKVSPGEPEAMLTLPESAEAVRHTLEAAIQTATGIEGVSARWL